MIKTMHGVVFTHKGFDGKKKILQLDEPKNNVSEGNIWRNVSICRVNGNIKTIEIIVTMQSFPSPHWSITQHCIAIHDSSTADTTITDGQKANLPNIYKAPNFEAQFNFIVEDRTAVELSFVGFCGQKNQFQSRALAQRLIGPSELLSGKSPKTGVYNKMSNIIPGLFNKAKLKSNNEHIMAGFVCLIEFTVCSFLLGCVAKMCREALHWKGNQTLKSNVTGINWFNPAFVKYNNKKRQFEASICSKVIGNMQINNNNKD